MLGAFIFPESPSLPAEPLLRILDEELGLPVAGDSVVLTANLHVCLQCFCTCHELLIGNLEKMSSRSPREI